MNDGGAMLDRRPQTVLMAEMTWPEYAALVAERE